MKSRLVQIGLALCAVAVSLPVSAAQRTFVASTGNDANPCSLTLPCRGFAAAIAAVASGGEVITLDSAGYGAFTVAKSVSVVAPAGVYAGITVFSGAGITVTPSPDDVVVLRGLTLVSQYVGYGPPTEGIHFDGAGQLLVDGVRIEQMKTFGIGVIGVGAAVIRDCALYRNQIGISTPGNGAPTDISVENTTIADSIEIAIALGGARVTIDNVRLINQAGSSALGIYAMANAIAPPVELNISNSVIRGFLQGLTIDKYPAAQSSTAIVGSEITLNATAIAANGGATVALQGNRLTHNMTVFVAGPGSTIFTGGNNYVARFTTLQAGPGTYAPPSGSY